MLDSVIPTKSSLKKLNDQTGESKQQTSTFRGDKPSHHLQVCFGIFWRKGEHR